MTDEIIAQTPAASWRLQRLLSCTLLLVEVGEAFAFFRQLFQEWRWLPPMAMLLVKFNDAFINFFQAHRVCEAHRAAALVGKTVAGEIDDVDVHGPQRVTLFQNARTFVDQGVNAAVDNFLCADLPLLDASFSCPLTDQLSNFRIGNGATLGVIFVPTCASLLTVTAQLAQIVFRQRLASTRFFQMTILFAEATAYSEPGKIAHGQRAHGHAVVVERFVDRLDTRAFFHQELRFTPIRPEHAVSDKATAVPYQHSNFAQLLGKLHARRDDFFAAGLATDNFQQPHYVRRAEEMGADHSLWPRSGRSDFINAQRGRVAGQDCARLTDAVHLAKDFLLQRHTFKHCLNHHVHVGKIAVAQSWLDQVKAF